MNLTKKMQVLLSVTALTALAAAGMLLSPAPEVEASGSCYPHVLNFNVWGSGPTCAAATSDLGAQGQAKAAQICGYLDTTPCGAVTTVPTNSCYFESGMWKIDGQVTFQCNN